MKLLNQDETWSFINKFINILLNSVLLLMIAKHLPNRDLALWYLFGSIFTVIGIIEGGFMQTISRHITYILHKKETHIGFEINIFINTSNKIFKYLIVIIVVSSLLFGTLYLYNYDKIILNNSDYLIWFVFLISGIFGLYANLYSSILIGYEKVATTQKINIYSTILNFIFVLFSFVIIKQNNLLFFILSLCTSRFVWFILCFVNANKLFSRIITYKSETSKEIRTFLFNDMKKMTINLISFNLLTSLFYLLIANYYSVNFIASFGFTNQILTYILGFTTIFLTSNTPKFASIFSKQNMAYLNSLFIKKSVISTTLYLICIVLLLTVFPIITTLFFFKTNILTGSQLYSFIFYISIEFIISILSIYLITCNELRLMYVSFLASLFIIANTFLLIHFNQNINIVFISRGIISVLFLFVPSFIFIRKINKSNKIKTT